MNGVDIREEQETIKPISEQEHSTSTNFQISENPIKPKKNIA